MSEPLKLSLEKKYYLNVMKEIMVTNSFLTLDKNTRGCQEESFDDCITRKYMATLIHKCQCLPFTMKTIQQVKYLPFRSFNFDLDYYDFLGSFMHYKEF